MTFWIVNEHPLIKQTYNTYFLILECIFISIQPNDM